MNISISLTPELLDLVNAKVGSGRDTSISEVWREALRLTLRPDVDDGARALVVPLYLVLDWVAPEAVQVVRVLRDARHPDSSLFDERLA